METIKGLTGKQWKVYLGLVDYWEEYGYAPSLYNLKIRAGYKQERSVLYTINKLCRMGLVTKDDGVYKSYKPLPKRRLVV